MKERKSSDMEPWILATQLLCGFFFENLVEIEPQKLNFHGQIFCHTNAGFFLCKTLIFAYPACESHLNP